MNVAALLRVHAGRRLVEQQQLRLGRERPRHLEPALVAVAQVARVLLSTRSRGRSSASSSRRLVVRLALLVALRRRAQDAADDPALACGSASRRARSRARSSSGRGGCSGTSGRSRAAVICVRRQADRPRAVEHDLARRRRVDAGQHVEERRLARAVRADQADDRAARHREVDVVEGDQAAELLAQPCGDEEVVGVLERRSSARCRQSALRRRARPRARPLRSPGIRPCGRSSITPR